MRRSKHVLYFLLLICSFFMQLAYGQQAKPDLRTSYVEYGTPQNLSYAGVKRIRAFIVVPQGRTEEEVRETLKRAAVAIGQREKALATDIWAYRPQDNIASGPFTVGSATYAPNGRWEDAALKAPMSVSLDLAKIYFQDPSPKFAKGQQVTLISKIEKSIDVSQSRDNWSQSNIIARLPQNTPAIVLESYEKPSAADYIFIRHLVRVNWEGKTIEGWVHGENVTKR